MQEVIVNSPNVKYTDSHIETKYEYHTTKVETIGNKLYASPLTDSLHIRTGRKPAAKLGVLLVGWGGNNGTTLTAALLANRHHLTWPTRSTDAQAANWYGSLTQAATVRLGNTVRDDDDDVSKGGNSSEVYVPLGALVPLTEPNSLVVGGWDISGADMAAAMDRARVLEPTLRDQLREEMSKMKPMRGLYDRDFIAANQSDRADNVMSPSASRWEQVTQLVNDIRNFRRSSGCDDIIVVWTANTERFSAVLPGVHDTQEGLTAAIKSDHKEVSPSTLYAYAAIEAGCLAYINGSPQNTFVPGLIEFAESRKVFIAGDDFKSGQTKIKSVLVDFLVGAGIKPVSIVSYNHLGNNDGKNLSAPQQFRSKEISKSNVVDDMVASNPLLYAPGETPDHCVVIKYVPYVGDSKRALDEYTSEIMMGGHNTLVVHNTCEDSLLAAPIILDLIVLAEFATRVQFKQEHDTEYTGFHPVLSLLSYLCKAPLVPRGSPVVNALFKQRACIENVLRACVGLPPDNSMHLEYKVPTLMKKHPVADITQCNGHAEKKRKVLNGK